MGLLAIDELFDDDNESIDSGTEFKIKILSALDYIEIGNMNSPPISQNSHPIKYVDPIREVQYLINGDPIWYG